MHGQGFSLFTAKGGSLNSLQAKVSATFVLGPMVQVKTFDLLTRKQRPRLRVGLDYKHP
jgi:hypothetical protein